MRIYVIGPVSGHDDLNAPAFEEARKRLYAAGFFPLIPHDFVSEDADWQRAMRCSLETIAKADGIAYLEGWDKSYGARLEERIAHALGIEFAAIDEWCNADSCIQALSEKEIAKKQCAHCKRVLPVTLFSKSSKSSDGYQSYCRDCMAAYTRERKSA